ncbi:MAG: hypothetical protein KJ017_02325 [Alphaproteobacteria bacterium]|nr:hypothetical protein [Alphaproteobacteria bacterium]
MKSIDSALEMLGYKATPAGIFRIALWALFFLVISGLYLPQKERDMPFAENTKGLAITPLITLPSDPAFINDEAQQVKADLKIAWISDSSSVIYKPGAKFLDFATMGENALLPVETLKALKPLSVHNSHIDLYIRLSLRSLESFTLTQLALARDTDLIVLTLNPFFVFNNHSIFKGDSHFPRASQTWVADRSAWPWLPLFPSPSDHLWALWGRHFDIFARAPAFAEDIHDTKIMLWSALFPALKGEDSKPLRPESAQNLKENAMIFWVTQRYLKGDMSKLVNDKNEAVNSKWYRQLIRLTDLDETSFNHAILIRTLEQIKASGKRALIYLAPVSENLRDDKAAWMSYQTIKAELERLKKLYDSEKMRLIINMEPEVLQDTVFAKDDDVHVNDSGKLSAFLASQIQQLTQTRAADQEKEYTP